MTSYVPPKKNSAFILPPQALVSQANRPLFQNDPTLAAGDVRVSKDGGALTNLTYLPTGTEAGTPLIGVQLDATEMNGDNISILFVDVAGAEWDDLLICIQTTANQIDDLATAANLNVLQLDLNDIHDDVDDTFFLATGLATSGSVSGLNALLTGGDGLATINTAVNNVFDDVGDVYAAVTNIQTRVPAALISDRMDSSVGAMAANVLTAAALAADAATEIAAAVWVSATRTLTSFGTLVADTAAAVWAYATRTLTSSGVAVAAAVAGSTISLTRGDTLSAALTGLGSLDGRTKLWFAVKSNTEYADTSALILIRETDGLIYLNGAPGTADQGSITVTNEATGALTIALAAAASASLAEGDYTYDIQVLTPTGVTTLRVGTFTVVADVTRATA